MEGEALQFDVEGFSAFYETDHGIISDFSFEMQVGCNGTAYELEFEGFSFRLRSGGHTREFSSQDLKEACVGYAMARGRGGSEPRLAREFYRVCHEPFQHRGDPDYLLDKAVGL